MLATTHEADIATILATHGEPNRFPGVWRRREAVLIAEVERLREANRRLEDAVIDERVGAECGPGMMSDAQYAAHREETRRHLRAEGLLPPE
jgi:hypothetical protein